jgi:hypothetical protein
MKLATENVFTPITDITRIVVPRNIFARLVIWSNFSWRTSDTVRLAMTVTILHLNRMVEVKNEKETMPSTFSARVAFVRVRTATQAISVQQ